MIPILALSLAIIACVLIYIAIVIGNKNYIKLTEAPITLTDVIPIHAIEDDFIINGNGDITVGYKLFLPEVFSLSDSVIDDIHISLENMLKMLPPGTIFHQQNFVYTLDYAIEQYSENFLYKTNLRNLKGREVMNSYTNIYITFTDNILNLKKNPANTSLLKKAAVPLKKPFDIEKRVKDIKTVLLNIESSFDSISSFSVIRLKSEELNNNLFDYINLSYDKPTNNATEEAVDPISITDSDNLKIGDKLVSVVSLVEEGGSLYSSGRPKGVSQTIADIQLPNTERLKSGMIYPLMYGLPFNHVLNVVIEVTDSESVISALKTEKASLNVLANFYSPAKEKQNEIDQFCNQVSANSFQTSYTSVNLIIHDQDKDRLALKTALAKQNFSNMNQSTSYIENEETANILFATIPGNARANYRGFVNVTQQAISYLNKEGLYISTKKGFLYFDRFGNPIRIDLWNNPLLDNKNRIVIGPSGSGKSFWLNYYILQLIVNAYDVIIIDIGGSYKNLIKLNNGKYFDSRKKNEFQFNPFLCPKDRAGRYIYIDTEDEDSKDDLIKTLATIVAFIWKGNREISPIEYSLLKKSILSYYEFVNREGAFPDMSGYRDYLPAFFASLETYQRSIFNIEEIKELLEPYTEGELSYLLNAKEDINIVDDTLIAYDMEEVKGKDHFPIVAILTLTVIIDKIKKRRGIPKTLIIDEALDFLVDAKFGDLIGMLFRQFRKKEGEITIAAQNVQFIMNAAPLVRESILANADTKIILEHGEKYKKQVTDLSVLNFTQEEQDQILGLQRSDNWREFGIKLGNSFFIFRNGVSRECSVAFDSRQSTVVEIENLYKQKGSIPAAIYAFLENQKKIMT